MTQMSLISKQSAGANKVDPVSLYHSEQFVDVFNRLLEVSLIGSYSSKFLTIGSSGSGSGSGSNGDDEFWQVVHRVLKLHYRLHYNVFKLDNDLKMGKDCSWKKDRFQVILCDGYKLERELNHNVHLGRDDECFEVLEMTLFNVIGVCCYYLQDFNKSKEYLQMQKTGIPNSSVNSDSVSGKYKVMLRLESFYYLTLLSLSSSQQHMSLSDIIHNGIPKRTESMSLYYLNMIIDTMDSPERREQRDNKNLLLDLYQQIHLCQIDDEKLLSVGESILKDSKFPKANEQNNSMLEEFHYLLTFHSISTTTTTTNTSDDLINRWETFFKNSINATFQSINVAYSTTVFYNRWESTLNNKNDTKSNNPTEIQYSQLHFENFIIYSNKFKELNDNQYSDIVSMIALYQVILQTQSHHKTFINDTRLNHITTTTTTTTTSVIKLLEFLYDYYELSLIGREESKTIESNQKINSLIVPQCLSMVLRKIWFTLYEEGKSDLKNLLDDESTFYLANVLQLDGCYQDDEDKIDVLFEYALCLAKQKEIVLSSKFLKNQILNHWPENNIKSWLLLCLLESCHENKSNSFKISCSVLESITTDNEAHPELSFANKWYAIQLKMTQLSLVQDMFGTPDALEMLPELFQLYQTLFETEGLEKKIVDKNSINNIQRSKEYLLQSVWIFVANLYFRDGTSIQDAQDSLTESENVANVEYTNLNVIISKGYLNNDITFFEKAIRHDPYNVDALVGWATTLFKRVTLSELSESDNSAISYLKLKLELCLENSIEGHFCPEIWFYLSKIYELFNDQARLESALLNCIKFAEEEPIRDFKYCQL